MTLKDIIDYCRAAAIADALFSSEEADYRYICRQYSKAFHTPLHLVYLLDAEEVCRAFFEDQMDQKDVEKELETLLDIVYEIEDPNYQAEKRGELKNFMKQAEREEKERIAKGKPIHPGMKADAEVSLVPTTPAPELPKSGKVDLGYLADDENER